MKKWLYNGEEYTDARECAEAIMDNAPADAFDDMLDEVYQSVILCGIEFYPSQILERCDPVAYRCYSSDWKNEEADELARCLERMDGGEEEEFFGEYVECSDPAPEDMSDEELAETIKAEYHWPNVKEEVEELCKRAGLLEEYEEADGETFEAVIYKAAEVLGVEV